MAKLKFSRTDDTTSRLPFKPLEKYDNLCLGHLTDVVTTSKVSDEDKEWEFAGYDVTRIALNFIQHREKEDTTDRYYTYSEIPQTVVRKDGSEMKESTVSMRYEKIWNKLKHVYDSYKYAPNWKVLPFDPSFDPEADVPTRLKEWDVFFKKMADAFMKGKDKENPIFPVTIDKTSLMTMKIVANGNRLTFPEFASTGFIEKTVMKGTKLETLLEFKYNETVTVSNNRAEAQMPNVQPGQFQGTGGANLSSKLADALE